MLILGCRLSPVGSSTVGWTTQTFAFSLCSHLCWLLFVPCWKFRSGWNDPNFCVCFTFSPVHICARPLFIPCWKFHSGSNDPHFHAHFSSSYLCWAVFIPYWNFCSGSNDPNFHVQFTFVFSLGPWSSPVGTSMVGWMTQSFVFVPPPCSCWDPFIFCWGLCSALNNPNFCIQFMSLTFTHFHLFISLTSSIHVCFGSPFVPFLQWIKQPKLSCLFYIFDFLLFVFVFGPLFISVGTYAVGWMTQTLCSLKTLQRRPSSQDLWAPCSLLSWIPCSSV